MNLTTLKMQLMLKKELNGSYISKLEEQIDKLVYKLYNLSEEEIKTIEEY